MIIKILDLQMLDFSENRSQALTWFSDANWIEEPKKTGENKLTENSKYGRCNQYNT